jgi:hypothetical protein
MLKKQLDYFKCKYKALNKTQMNMDKVISNLIEIMGMVLKWDKGKEPFIP